MSKGLVKLMKKHPRYFNQYRSFVVRVMLDLEAKKKANEK